ncbi:MAG: HD domain-containing protein [Chloroflexota bacterium]
MSLTESQRTKIANYVRRYIIRSAERHGLENGSFRANARWMHTLNTYRNVELILDGEHAAPETRAVCEAAALFHDVDHYTVQEEYHAMRGAETATRFLTKEGYPSEFISRVAIAVREHDRDLDDDIPIEEQVQQLVDSLNMDSRMVLDADTLDKIGVSNILQAVSSMGGTNRRQVSEIASELTAGWPLQRAKLWKAMLTTNTGRKLGEQRFAFYENFLREVESEIVMLDPYPDVTVTPEVATV